MSWIQRLAKAVGLIPQPDPMLQFKDEDAAVRIHETLLRNPAVGGNDVIAAELASNGELVGFSRGDNIVVQGSDSDDVFFLVFGAADILVNGRKRTYREAPNQVGEMAAIEPSKQRTATVRVRSETACALKVSGTVFRNIWKHNSEFMDRLHLEMAARQREQLSASQVVKENLSLAWFLVSIAVAIFVGAMVWFVTESLNWTEAARLILVGFFSVAAFLGALFLNPMFLWRRSFSVLLWFLLGKSVFETSISFETSQGFGTLRLRLMPGEGTVDLITSIGTSLPIIAVMALCMWKDHLENRS